MKPNTIRMNVSSGSKDAALVRLEKLSVEAVVLGNIATTTLDMIFVNSSDRVLEGELEFPLNEGEAVTGYALDINGTMREGVVVEKEKGRQVFESVVRRGIDPGLVEKTSGNNFKTRVYPLPAKGSRHVRITYEGEVSSSEAGSKKNYVYSALPQGLLSSFSFRLTVLDSNGLSKEVAATEKDGIPVIDMESLSGGKTVSFAKENYELKNVIAIALPKTERSRSVFTQTVGKDTYFYAYLPLEKKTEQRPLPKNVTVFFDVSSSRAGGNLERELSLLKAYLMRLSSPSVKIVPFSNTVHDSFTASGKSGDALFSQVESFIRSLDFDGATNLNIDFAGDSDSDEVLVFTDGISNWNDVKQKKSEGSASVHFINSSPSANHALLKQLSSSLGGNYVNLLTANDSEALARLSESFLHLLSVEYDDKFFSEIYPLPGENAGDDFSVSGILLKKSGEIRLNFGFTNKVIESVSVNVSASDPEYERVPRLWAVKKIESLSVNSDDNREEIISVAKKFSVVTDETSLIVLDDVHDYVRYGIVPPDELKDEYNRIVSSSAQVKGGKKDILDSVYSCFNEYKKWWNTKPGEFKKKEKNPPVFGGRRRIYQEMNLMSESVEADAPEAMMMLDTASVNSARASAAPAAELGVSAVASNSLQMKDSVANKNEGSAVSVKIQAWNPDSPYLSVLKKTKTSDMWKKYISLKDEWGASPSFYMEVSDYFAEENLFKESIRILSNLAELNLENSDLLRALGNKLVERNEFELAIPVFEKLTKIRAEIPQFYRDLALCYLYAERKQEAADTLYKIVCGEWDSRFSEVQQIALNDMNSIIAGAKKIDTSKYDKKLIENFDLDVRIVLTWNTDDCDVDLWVTDSDGEKCYYGNRYTANGARLSRDFTQGYGPEEFCIKNAPKGNLKIEANYFGNHQQKQMQPVIVQAEVYTNFERPDQSRKVLTLRLDDVKQTFFIGEVNTNSLD